MQTSNISRTTLALALGSFLVGCTGASFEDLKDISKDVEGRGYNTYADFYTFLCEFKKQSRFGPDELNELMREARQRGEGGPPGPVNPIDGLDDKTAYGEGAIVIVLCADDEVPWEYVGPLLIRRAKQN